VWIPRPSLKTAVAAWIYAGGSHHTGFSQALGAQHLQDFAEIAGIEFLRIGKETNLDQFKDQLRWNNASYVRTN
jgi:L-arabinose isomerase